MTTPIPQPPRIPFFGNAAQLDKELPVSSYQLLAQTYGEIYQLTLQGRKVIVVNTHALVDEISDDKRFRKAVQANLVETRHLFLDGLVTAYSDEPNWGIAHRILMPAFGTASIRGMMEDMRDICNQMLVKWERFGPDTIIDPSDDFTRVALDAIAFCAMSYRFNSFYTEHQPAFAQALSDFFKESYMRTLRPSVVQAMMTGTTAKYEADQKLMKDVADHIVADRKAHPSDRKDILNIMLNGKDPKTGQGLSDDNITRNLLTFLAAGHETSSGTLSFTVYYLIKHPDVMRKLRAEIDEIVGDRPVQFEDLSKMTYLTAVLRESMRLSPTASTRAVESVVDTTIGGGKYFIPALTTIVSLTWVMQKDPTVWGNDVHEFRPERMLDGKFESLPRNAWQPFGYGARACIGRPFAWQEIQLVLVSVLQKFDLSLVDPSYNLHLKQALTIKPRDFLIRAKLRNKTGNIIATPSVDLIAARKGGSSREVHVANVIDTSNLKPMYIAYGSNTGTSESFAQRVASDAPSYGFNPIIGSLDSFTGHLPTDGPIIVITASFEGQPADNAAQFVDWISNADGNMFSGVKYGVFGCGNREWVRTFQRIPALIDESIGQNGGKRLIERGVGDVSQGEFFQVFDTFEDSLWDALSKEYNTTKEKSPASGFEVQTVNPGIERAAHLRQPDVALGKVVENRVLTKPGAPVKRHIEFALPEGMTYRAGDYLAILPHNPPRDVRRVLAHFSLSEEHEVIISSVGPTSFPVGKPVILSSILSGYVELSQPATTRDLRTLIDAAKSASTCDALAALIAAYAEEVLAKRISVLDILEKYSDIELSLSTFLRMLPAMRVRQYSISSSPLWNPQNATLTVSIIDSPSSSGNTERFLGVASNYLGNLRVGDRVQIATRPSAAGFEPPVNPLIPMVMFCAGSGLAPMRGFIQERAQQKKSEREVGQILLFFGCRSPDEDYLYADGDLAEWIKLGIVDVRPAFSKSAEISQGCKYVQDRIWHDREDIIKAYRKDAAFFTCGSGKVATGIKDALLEVIKVARNTEDAQALVHWEENISKGRYHTDIFD